MTDISDLPCEQCPIAIICLNKLDNDFVTRGLMTYNLISECEVLEDWIDITRNYYTLLSFFESLKGESNE